MAELSRFFGIIIRMFAEHGGGHHTPHFHAVYQDYEAVFTIEPVKLSKSQILTVIARRVPFSTKQSHRRLKNKAYFMRLLRNERSQ